MLRVDSGKRGPEPTGRLYGDGQLLSWYLDQICFHYDQDDIQRREAGQADALTGRPPGPRHAASCALECGSESLEMRQESRNETSGVQDVKVSVTWSQLCATVFVASRFGPFPETRAPAWVRGLAGNAWARGCRADCLEILAPLQLVGVVQTSRGEVGLP